MAAYRICCRSISGRLREARAGQRILCAVVIRSFRLFIRLGILGRGGLPRSLAQLDATYEKKPGGAGIFSKDTARKRNEIRTRWKTIGVA